MGKLQDFISFVVFLGVLITVHELGHFLVAKACNVKVLKFSIGFGPRIFGFTRGETEYRIAWIPLGGYVKMAGEMPGEDVDPADAKRSFLNQSPWKRAAIVVAGPVFNLVFPLFAFFFVLLGNVEDFSTRVGWLDSSAPAAMAGIRVGDRIRSIEGKPVKTFDELRAAMVGRFERPIDIEVERDGKTFIAKPTPLRQKESDGVEELERGILGFTSSSLRPLIGVPPGSPAAGAGFHTFDRVVALNGAAVTDEVALFDLLRRTSGQMTVTVLRPELSSAGPVQLVKVTPVTLTVERTEGDGYAALGGAEWAGLYVWNVRADSPAAKAGLKAKDRLTTLDGKALTSPSLFKSQLETLETRPFELGWRSGTEEKTARIAQVVVETTDELKTPREILDLGVVSYAAPELSRPAPAELITIHRGPIEAATASVAKVGEVTRKIVIVIGKLFTGRISIKTVGGPVTLFQVATMSAEAGLNTFVDAMAVLSINLGLMNLLPIPVLDGFALLAALWEGIRRRPIPIRAREYANMVGLAMLALLMVVVLKNDITKLLR